MRCIYYVDVNGEVCRSLCLDTGLLKSWAVHNRTKSISLLQKLRQSWEEIEENKTSAGVSAEQMYACTVVYKVWSVAMILSFPNRLCQRWDNVWSGR